MPLTNRTAGDWAIKEAKLDRAPGSTFSFGVIALAPDRVGCLDFERFLCPLDGLAVFSTRVPLAATVTPESLAKMGDYLAFAASLLVPGSHLDAIAFSCTSGTVAIGTNRVRAAIGEGRPGIPVHTPIDAGVAASNPDPDPQGAARYPQGSEEPR